MSKIRVIALYLIAAGILASCQAAPTATPTVSTPPATPTSTAVLATPTIKIWPTASAVAPDEPVIPVGYVATFQDTQHGVSGKAVMAGLQTIVISNFTYDGQGPLADIRLVKEGELDKAVAILAKLEQRPYQQELLVLTVPSDLKPGDADSIAVYCEELKASFGWGRFQ
nr:DM13 domain-containing protein [Chloroflexota bacterium]